MTEKRVLYKPGDGRSFVRTADIVYRKIDSEELGLDLYRPTTEAGSPFPVVILVHGDGPPELLRDIKDSGQYVSWGELIGSTGFAAVTFNHRSSREGTRMFDVASDIEAGFEFVQSRAAEWNLDASRVGLWTCSMGVPFAMRLAVERASTLRCVVALYGPMDLPNDPGDDATMTADSRQEFSPLYHLRAGRDLPPLFIGRAGRDDPLLNATIDAFVVSALKRNLEINVFNHPTGDHAFDIRDDSNRTRDVIEAALHFYQRHL